MTGRLTDTAINRQKKINHQCIFGQENPVLSSMYLEHLMHRIFFSRKIKGRNLGVGVGGPEKVPAWHLCIE